MECAPKKGSIKLACVMWPKQTLHALQTCKPQTRRKSFLDIHHATVCVRPGCKRLCIILLVLTSICLFILLHQKITVKPGPHQSDLSAINHIGSIDFVKYSTAQRDKSVGICADIYISLPLSQFCLTRCDVVALPSKSSTLQNPNAGAEACTLREANCS